MGAWRRTGDVSELAAVAAEMEPSWRRVFLDAILPTGLRHDLESLLRHNGAVVARQRVGS